MKLKNLRFAGGGLFLVLLALGLPLRGNDNLEPILRLVLELDDAAVQRDLLKGMREGLAGKRNLKPPPSWAEVSAKLGASGNAALREETRLLGLVFGDEASVRALRAKALDDKAPTEERRRALRTLVEKKAKGLADDLRKLLDDDALRIDALRGLAAFGTAGASKPVLARYAGFSPEEKREAVQLLVSRPAFADALLAAMAAGQVPRADVTVFDARRIHDFGGEERRARLREVWGELRPVSGDKKALYARYKKLLTPEFLKRADLPKGRLLYQRTCGACHKLYGEGGLVGPDLTGSDRGTLQYLLENVLEPNAVIPKDYQLTVFVAKDGRVLSGVLVAENADRFVVRLLTEEVVLPRSEVEEHRTLPVSMMPEGIFQYLPDEDVRDLIAYLMGTEQVALPKE